MSQQDGPAPIERVTLYYDVCQWCGMKFKTIVEAKAHDATCPEHPAVQQLAEATGRLIACREDFREMITERDAALQQLAVAKADVERLQGELVRKITHEAPTGFIPISVMEQLREQLAVAKRFIVDIIELYNKSYEVQGPDIWDAAMKHGILVETTYDPTLDGEQDAEVGDPWYVVAPEWRADDPYRAARGVSPTATDLAPEDAIRRGRE